MKDIGQIPIASIELTRENEDTSFNNLQLQLVKALEAQGKRTILIGRSIATIERCDQNENPPGMTSWGVLKISLYPDPDAVGVDKAEEIYISGGRSGIGRIVISKGHSDEQIYPKK